MHWGQSIKMSDSAPVKMANRRISAAILSWRDQHRWKYSHCFVFTPVWWSINIGIFVFGGTLVCVLCIWGSIYLESLRLTSELNKGTISYAVWRPSGVIARTSSSSQYKALNTAEERFLVGTVFYFHMSSHILVCTCSHLYVTLIWMWMVSWHMVLF